MDKLATMDTIGSSFRPWLSCQGICLLNRHQTGDTDSVQPVILLPVQRDSQETFILCEARMLWYSADRTSSQQLRDTTFILHLLKFRYDTMLHKVYVPHTQDDKAASVRARTSGKIGRSVTAP